MVYTTLIFYSIFLEDLIPVYTSVHDAVHELISPVQLTGQHPEMYQSKFPYFSLTFPVYP